MPSNNSKYTDEMRERTVLHILSSGKSATSVAEELGIDVNTVCRWVREHRRKNNLPSYEEEKEIVFTAGDCIVVLAEDGRSLTISNHRLNNSEYCENSAISQQGNAFSPKIAQERGSSAVFHHIGDIGQF